jgi:hypothetical protein
MLRQEALFLILFELIETHWFDLILKRPLISPQLRGVDLVTLNGASLNVTWGLPNHQTT